MLKPLENSMETYKHICRQGAGQPAVYLHDVHAYMEIDGKMVWTPYCPYCGIEIDREERGGNDEVF